MIRITGTYVEPDANGAGKDGFRNGTPGVQAATGVDAAWLNHVQEEIALAVEGAGLTLSSSEKNQLAQALVTGVTISPAAISATQNDWSPTGHGPATDVRVSNTDAAYGLNGFAADSARKLKRFTNVGPNAFPLYHENAGSSAVNRFDCPADATYRLQPGDTVWARYDATTQRWRVLDRDITPLDITWGGNHVFSLGATASAGEDFGVSGGGAFAAVDSTIEPFQILGSLPVHRVPISITAGFGTGEFAPAGGGFILQTSATPSLSDFQSFQLFLPSDSVLNEVEVGCEQASNTASDMTIIVYRVPKSGSELDTPVVLATQAVTVFGSADTVHAFLGLPEIINNEANRYYVVVQASDSSGGVNTINWADALIEYSGPRNY